MRQIQPHLIFRQIITTHNQVEVIHWIHSDNFIVIEAVLCILYC